jgi:hypothetical protein
MSALPTSCTQGARRQPCEDCEVLTVLNQTKDVQRSKRVACNVKNLITDQVKGWMRELDDRNTVTDVVQEVDQAFQAQTAGELSAELYEMDGSVPQAVQVDPSEVQVITIEEELQRWNSQPTVYVDLVLGYWERNAKHFHLLSRVAHVVFGFPTSSGQIGRDFGDTGRMVTMGRVGLKGNNVDG